MILHHCILVDMFTWLIIISFTVMSYRVICFGIHSRDVQQDLEQPEVEDLFNFIQLFHEATINVECIT